MTQQVIENCRQMIQDRSKPPEVRAQFIALYANEVGLDLVPALAEMISQTDLSAQAQKELKVALAKLEELQQEAKVTPLQPEVFLHTMQGPEGEVLVILTQSGMMICPPAAPLAKLTGCLERGEFVLIDKKNGLAVARDGALRPTGELVTIEEVPATGSYQATIRKRDECFTAHLSTRAQQSEHLRAGARAVYDPMRQFVYDIVEPQLDGSDLLTPPEQLASFTLDSLGSPHPVIEEILMQVRQESEHAEWNRQLGASPRRGYLLHGPTGTGKSTTIKVLVNEIADWMEEVTGVREARVVFCDASSFYSPYFGEAEQKVTDWFKKLDQLAQHKVRTAAGEEFSPTLIVVLEEIEGIVRSRGEQGGSSHLFDRVLSLILQKMDSASTNHDRPILFLTTTNCRSVVDPAAKRRFGDREVFFGPLDARGAISVLEKKIPEGTPVRGPDGFGDDSPEARANLIDKIAMHLFGDAPDQVIAEVTLRDGANLPVHRRDFVTGAILDSAVNRAKDACLKVSVEHDAMVGIDPDGMVEILTEQYRELAGGLSNHNIGDYFPDLLDGRTTEQIAGVRPV